MKKLKGTKSFENLQKAFAGESMARNKYEFFASIAKKEGCEQIAAIFQKTANNEKEHAKMWYKALCGGKIGSTKDNLMLAASGENEEWTNMYKQFMQDARKEGFNELADMFENVGRVEKTHEERFKQLKENLETGKIFRRSGATIWECRNCGFLHVGESAPDKCPACAHDRGYFELFAKNY